MSARIQPLVMSEAYATRLGFPSPYHPDLVVIDNVGRFWQWIPDTTGALGSLGGWWQSLIGVGGGIGAKVTPMLATGPIGAAIGAGIGLITTILSSIFGAHAAKAQHEDQISNAWAAQGPAAIDAVMQAFKSGQVSASDAISGLQQIEQQFMQQSISISKYNGNFGAFPDPNGPRPSSNCNWACGTFWDLHQQIKGLIAQIQSSPSSGGGGLDSLLTGSPVMLIGLAVLGFMMLK